MARGTPDYGTGIQSGVVFEITDLGELAARLGGIVIPERSGNLIAGYNFNDNLGMVRVLATGADNAVHWTNLYTLCSKGAVKLLTDDTAAGLAQIESYLGGRYSGLIGLSSWFSIEDHPTNLIFELAVNYNDIKYISQLVYVPASKLWKYAITGSTFETLETFDVGYSENAGIWHNIKIVLNVSDELYHRVIIDGKEYDLSSVSLVQAAEVSYSYITWNITSQTTVAATSIVYVDAVALTINERE